MERVSPGMFPEATCAPTAWTGGKVPGRATPLPLRLQIEKLPTSNSFFVMYGLYKKSEIPYYKKCKGTVLYTGPLLFKT